GVGSMLFKNNVPTIINRNSYEIIGDNREPRTKKMWDTEFIDMKGIVFRHIDVDENIWLTSTALGDTWKLTKSEFESALSAPTVRSAGYTLSDGVTTLTEAETHRELMVNNLPSPIYGTYTSGMRDLGNGEVALYGY